MPPASTEAGGVVLSSVPLATAGVLVLEGLPAVAAAAPAAVLYTTDVTVPGLPWEAPGVAEASEPEVGEAVADDPLVIVDPSVADDPSEEVVAVTGAKGPYEVETLPPANVLTA